MKHNTLTDAVYQPEDNPKIVVALVDGEYGIKMNPSPAAQLSFLKFVYQLKKLNPVSHLLDLNTENLRRLWKDVNTIPMQTVIKEWELKIDQPSTSINIQTNKQSIDYELLLKDPSYNERYYRDIDVTKRDIIITYDTSNIQAFRDFEIDILNKMRWSTFGNSTAYKLMYNSTPPTLISYDKSIQQYQVKTFKSKTEVITINIEKATDIVNYLDYQNDVTKLSLEKQLPGVDYQIPTKTNTKDTTPETPAHDKTNLSDADKRGLLAIIILILNIILFLIVFYANFG